VRWSDSVQTFFPWANSTVGAGTQKLEPAPRRKPVDALDKPVPLPHPAPLPHRAHRLARPHGRRVCAPRVRPHTIPTRVVVVVGVGAASSVSVQGAKGAEACSEKATDLRGPAGGMGTQEPKSASRLSRRHATPSPLATNRTPRTPLPLVTLQPSAHWLTGARLLPSYQIRGSPNRSCQHGARC